MKQPWIQNAQKDLLFILAPPFIILAVIFLFQRQITTIENHYSFYTWLMFIVFIDVAHVYATLFKTYFKPAVFHRKSRLLIITPLVCLAAGLVLFTLGGKVFWTVLAYIAVFHFIRQQYGFMRLYSRQEPQNRWYHFMDNALIYAATGYPMLYWFIHQDKLHFNWFMPQEFYPVNVPWLYPIATILYGSILLLYFAKVLYQWFKDGSFNLPKNLLMTGTILSWYFGIVYFNDDLIFTMLNVVSHGIPYMALVYFREVNGQPTSFSGFLQKLSGKRLVLFYIIFLLGIAFAEEFTWDAFVWDEHFSWNAVPGKMIQWQIIMVPLLSVPQFTHYILDGFIWKKEKKETHSAQ